MPVKWKFLLYGGVHRREEPDVGRYSFYGYVCCREVRRCPPKGGVRRREVSVVGMCLLKGGVHCRELSVVGRCPFNGGVRCREVSVVGRCPL